MFVTSRRIKTRQSQDAKEKFARQEVLEIKIISRGALSLVKPAEKLSNRFVDRFKRATSPPDGALRFR